MFGRLIVNAGCFLLGYYLGKQFGLTEHIRQDLAEKREQDQHTSKTGTAKISNTAAKPARKPRQKKTTSKAHPAT